MPENGDIPLTGDPRVDAAIQRIRGRFRDLEDAMLVQVYLNRDAARIVKEVAQRMDRLEERDEQEAKDRKAKDAALDERVDKLVSAIGDLIRRIAPQTVA